MDKKAKLGVAAISLAAAATMLAPGTASAEELICSDCDIVVKDPFIKFQPPRLLPEVLRERLEPELFLKISTLFYKLS